MKRLLLLAALLAALVAFAPAASADPYYCDGGGNTITELVTIENAAACGTTGYYWYVSFAPGWDWQNTGIQCYSPGEYVVVTPTLHRWCKPW